MTGRSYSYGFCQNKNNDLSGQSTRTSKAEPMTPSILRNLGITFIAFGLAMGIIFPFYAQFFVEWKPGMYGWFVVGCLVAGTTIGIVNYALVNLVLIGKLRRISHVATAIGDKDVSLRCDLKSNDVVGEIVASFNRMAENLRQMIGRIGGVAGDLTGASVHLSEVTASAVERTNAEHQRAEQVSEAMNDLAHAIQEVTSSTRDAAEAALEARRYTGDGRLVVDETVTAIRRLAENVERTGGRIDALEKDAAAIESVLTMIRDIAEQTNLLSLNAAIEAARAGESGRGFAVVADEVRTLATRSHSATEEIRQTIERLRAETRAAVEAMQASREQAGASVERAGEAGRALSAIAGAVEHMTELNARIATASEAQQLVVETVTRDADAINRIARDGVEETNQLSAAGEELNRLAHSLQGYMKEFRT